MRIVNVTRNGVNIDVRNLVMEKQGERKSDTMIGSVVPYVDLTYGDKIQVVKDVIRGADELALYHSFNGTLLDESGHDRHLAILQGRVLPTVHYRFDGNLDDIGRSDLSLEANNPTFVDGFVDKALAGDAEVNTTWKFGQYSIFSISFVINVVAENEIQYVKLADNTAEFSVTRNSTDDVVIKIGNRTITVPMPLSTGWHEITVTYDASGDTDGIKLYIDGLQEVITHSTETLEFSIEDATLSVSGGGVGIDEVRIYLNLGITDTQILHNFWDILAKFTTADRFTQLNRYGDMYYEFPLDREVVAGTQVLAVDYKNGATKNIMRLTATDGTYFDITPDIIQAASQRKITARDDFSVNTDGWSTEGYRGSTASVNNGHLVTDVNLSNFISKTYEFGKSFKIRIKFDNNMGVIHALLVEIRDADSGNLIGQYFTTDILDNNLVYEVSANTNVDRVRVVIRTNSNNNLDIEYIETDHIGIVPLDDGIQFLNMNIMNGELTIIGEGGIELDKYPLPDIKRITYGHGVLNEESGIYWFRSYRNTIPYLRLQDLFVAEDKPILRYGGTIREIKDKISEKKIICRSYGQVLNEIDANYELETNRSARHILRRIISVYTDLLFIDNSTLDDVVIDSFVISGKLVEIIETLATIGGFAWTTNARGEFVILNYTGDRTSKSFKNGDGVIITKYEDDDTTVKNEIRLIGTRKTFRNQEVITLSANERIIHTVYPPIGSVSIIYQSTPLRADQYSYNTEQSVIVISDSVSIGNNTTADVRYDYNQTETFYQRDESSIKKVGIRSDRQIKRSLSTYEDAQRYATSLLNEKSTVKTGVKIVVPNIEEVVGVGDIVEIMNAYRSELDGAYQIKTLKAFYPQYKTEVIAGEYVHDQLERERDVTTAIHNLEDFDFVTAFAQRRTLQSDLKLALSMKPSILPSKDKEELLALKITASYVAQSRGLFKYGVSTYGDGSVYG